MTIQEAAALQPEYYPDEAIAEQLRHVTLLLFVGPAGIGKSTILDLVGQHDDRFGRTGSIGTRPSDKRDSPGLYRQLAEQAMIEKIVARSLVQYAIHPSGHMYATTIDMYHHAYNMLECQALAVEQFHRLPFGKLRVYYLVTEAAAWRAWFEARYPIRDKERAKRAHEAILSLEWGLNQPEGSLIWIENIPGTPGKAADQIIQSISLEEPFDNRRQLARQMLAIAREL